MAAKFEVGLMDEAISLVFDSAGGAPKKPGGVSRNADYDEALELIFRRLAQLGAILDDAYVDSRSTKAKNLTRDECRLDLPDSGYPIALAAVDDFSGFRTEFQAAQRVIGQEANTKGGNGQKRVRMQLTVPGFQPTPGAAERLELILSESQVLSDAQADTEAHVQGTSSEQSRTKRQGSGSSGQGFITDTATKLVIEKAAMAAAKRHYEAEKWSVVDVSTAKVGYDLLCERGNERLFVEVKGTTQRPRSVLVSRNEVSFALANPGSAALFVLSNVQISQHDGEPVATGGTPMWLEPWIVELDRLSATGYNYALDGLS